MTEVSAAQTNKKRHGRVAVPYGHERTLTVGAAISRPIGGSFVIGGRGRLRAPPVADTASKKVSQPFARYERYGCGHTACRCVAESRRLASVLRTR